MDSQTMAPCRIDFDETSTDKSRESLPVYLRIKPGETGELSIKIINETTVETNHPYRSNKKSTFTHVFKEEATQEEVFDVTTAPLLTKFLDGANVMTFAYGVTSSGKTYTIMGDHSKPGIIPLLLEKIFGSYRLKIQDADLTMKPVMFEGVQPLNNRDILDIDKKRDSLLQKVKKGSSAFDQYAFANTTRDIGSDDRLSPIFSGTSCNVWISVYEIYNEVITDLLKCESKGKRKALSIGQDPKGCTYVKDLVQIPVYSAAEAYGLLQLAKQNLAKASTKLNDNSSRSHMVFTLKMIHSGGSLSEPLVNQFVISDLAGSERQSKTGASGTLLKQASAINNSLMVLGRCLEALRKKDKGISAPFRDSKLTRMLNPFFTLGGYVSLIICINPTFYLQDETMETIRFSAIASEIVQDNMKPFERLQKLRRLTQEYIVNSPVKKVDEIESWQDAVYGSVVYDGVTCLEVRASYFNDMARDILRAEKMFKVKDKEIEELKKRLKNAETSKENIAFMYTDRMKEQADKYAEERENIRAAYKEDIKELMEDFDAENDELKAKYTKYKDGYVKVTDYLKEKLWPELKLFRERFGYMEEFPPKEGTTEDEEAKPENSIKYWQDLVQDKDDEIRSMKTELIQKKDELKDLDRDLSRVKELLVASEEDVEKLKKQLRESNNLVEELEEQTSTLRSDLANQEALIEEVDSLKADLRRAEDARETLVASYIVKENNLREELENIKAELREEYAEVEAVTKKLEDSEERASSLQKLVASLENRSSSGNSGVVTELTEEKDRLLKKLSALEEELKREHEDNMALQENILSMQEEKEALTEREEQLLDRENQFTTKMKEARRSKALEEDSNGKEEIQRLLKQLDEERESAAAMNVLLQSQAAELGELRDKATTIGILAPQLERLSEENREFRSKLKHSEQENKALENEVKETRRLQVEVEYLNRRLQNQHSRIFREQPQTEKPNRRRRSQSTSDIPKPPATERSRRRLRMENDENSIFDTTLNGTIRDPSPMATPYRTRASARRR